MIFPILLLLLLSMGFASADGNITDDDIKIIATRYGRVSVPYADNTLTEITCHGKGAAFLGG